MSLSHNYANLLIKLILQTIPLLCLLLQHWPGWEMWGWLPNLYSRVNADTQTSVTSSGFVASVRFRFRFTGGCRSTDLVILSVQDMVISCSPCRMPSHVCTGPRLRTGTVPSPDSILVRRWLRCFLMRCLLLCTAHTTHTVTVPSVHVIMSQKAGSLFQILIRNILFGETSEVKIKCCI